MNSRNTKASIPHRLLFNLLDKASLKRRDKYVALPSFSIYYIWEKIKKLFENSKFKISVAYSVSDIQDYFEYIIKKTSKSNR